MTSPRWRNVFDCQKSKAVQCFCMHRRGGKVRSSSQSSLLDCHTLWIGESLPPLFVSCLLSFVRAGHRVVVHAYQNIDLPRELEVRDAARILSPDRLDRQLRGAARPLLADYFRYELLEQINCLWIDVDLICIRPIDIDAPYIFGYESASQVNNAVLRAPPGSNLLQNMLALFRADGAVIPPWFGPTRRARYHIKKLVGIHRDLTTLPYASTGPRALTWYVGAEGLQHFVQPRDVFYPLSYLDIGRLRDPKFDLESIITPRTRCIHLWNQSLQMSTLECSEPLQRVLAATAS